MNRSTVGVLTVVVIAMTANFSAAAQTNGTAGTRSLQNALNTYVATRAKPEHISAASLSISLKGSPETIDLAAGTTRYPRGGAKVTPADLFEIGSITKSFTSVAILHLEAAGKLTIEDTLGKWLPQYPAWKNVKIRQLLDMTSPIPGYDNEPSIGNIMGNYPNHDFSPLELVAAAYPHQGKPKAVSGWTYSNTNYILAQMIIEKAGGKSYSAVVHALFRRVGLKNAYYEQNRYPTSITDRMVSGYFFNHDPGNEPLAPLLDRDVKNDSVSWMQGAGGIIASMQDVARWARALYEGPLLADKQRRELLTVVSDKTGQPLPGVSQANPSAFGLGVGGGYRPALGMYWYYQGMTLGYRVLYGYFPANGAVIVVGLNSQPDDKQNENGQLIEKIYGILHAAGKV
jgi:D-alanyl-D-alanine carboxypeptidase